MPHDDRDFESQVDLETLVRAREIEADPGRMGRVKEFAERRREEFGQLAEDLPGKPKRGFNGAVKNSSMAR